MEPGVHHSSQLGKLTTEAMGTRLPGTLHAKKPTENSMKRKVRSHTLGYLQAAMKTMVPRCGSLEVWKQSTDEHTRRHCFAQNSMKFR